MHRLRIEQDLRLRHKELAILGEQSIGEAQISPGAVPDESAAIAVQAERRREPQHLRDRRDAGFQRRWIGVFGRKWVFDEDHCASRTNCERRDQFCVCLQIAESPSAAVEVEGNRQRARCLARPQDMNRAGSRLAGFDVNSEVAQTPGLAPSHPLALFLKGPGSDPGLCAKLFEIAEIRRR